jgi:hypothetical protein
MSNTVVTLDRAVVGSSVKDERLGVGLRHRSRLMVNRVGDAV